MDTGPSPVCCPVCTLFLREGISLQNHLNTHPKDQVIEALVRYSAGNSNTREQDNCTAIGSISTPQIASNEQDDQSVLGVTASAVPSSPYPTFGSSHFTATAAITYQQFLSSNASAGGTVMPQYVSVPAILASPNSAQTAVMPVLYNPYLLQQQQQQQQQLQFYNSVRNQTPPSPLRQILPPVFQHSPAGSLQQSNNFSMSSTSAVPLMNQNTQTNGSPSTSSCSSPLPSPLPANISKSLHDSEGNGSVSCKGEINSTNQYCNNNVSSPNSPKSNVPVQCNEQRKGISTPPVELSKTSDEMPDPSLDVPFSDMGNINPSRVTETSCAQYINFFQYDKADNFIDELQKPNSDKETITLHQETYGNLSRDGATSPGLRVRTDLNNTSQQTDTVHVSRTVADCESGNITMKSLNSAGNSSQMIGSNIETRDLAEIIKGSLVVQLTQDSLDDNSEYITSDCNLADEANEDQTQSAPATTQPVKDNCNSNTGETEENSKLLDLDESGQVNIIEINGMHILVPSQFLDSTAMLGHNIAMLQAANREVDNNEQSSKTNTTDAEVPHVANLDIQTDELMPPRGELSEQESIGGNDNSIWVQAFRDREEDVSTSYDLLARESWAASDGSDAETTEGVAERRNTIAAVKRKGKVARVYKCWSCGESFNCPKERRVHQSKQHATNGESFDCPKERLHQSTQHNTNGESFNFPKEHTVHQSAQHVVIGESLDCLKEHGVHKNTQHVTSAASVPPPSSVKEEAELDSKFGVKAESPHFPLVFVKQDIAADSTLVESKSEEAKAVKEENSAFTCTQCEEVFPSVRCLRRHTRSTHKELKESKHTCGTCKENFRTEALLHEHLKIHPLECGRCGKYFYRRQNLNLHMKRHLGIKPYRCAICDKAFVTKQKLAEHTNSHTGNAPLKCTLCSETFRRYSNLIQHKNRYHLKIKKKIKDFICHCGEVFHSKKKLEWHKEIHDEKPKSCTFCSERFVHAASLTRHVRRAHDQRYVPKCGRENENVVCPVCSCVFLKSSLHVHMRVHSGERPFSCHICGKGFTTKWNLQLHRWTHASRSTKPFKCSLCKSAFFRRSDYTAHMHSHRNVRPYTCNYCGCQFIRKYNCIRHVKEHEADKSFVCTVCKKTFHRSYYLKEHMRIHSGSRPFTCHICGKASSTKSNHNKHVKIHHAREPVNTEG